MKETIYKCRYEENIGKHIYVFKNGETAAIFSVLPLIHVLVLQYCDVPADKIARVKAEALAKNHLL